MKVFLDKNKLSKVSKDFFNVFHTSISIWDRDGIVQVGYHNEPYCISIWERFKGNEKCLQCDIKATETVRKTRKPYSYTCHALINETIAPVYYNEDIVAFLCFGQYVNKDTAPTDDQLKDYCDKYGINYSVLKEKYNLLPKLSSEEIESATNIMTMCIHKLVLEQSIKWRTDPTIEKITQYIEENIAERVTVANICKTFYISKNKLYNAFETFHEMTVQKFITLRRVESAENLLKTTNDTVAIIAEKVGFNDYNNFIKLFKKNYGLTPLQYRKKNKI